MEEREYVLIRGTVEQIVFYNQENGYAVLRLAAEGGAEVTATGAFPNIGLGVGGYPDRLLGDPSVLWRAVPDRGI